MTLLEEARALIKAHLSEKPQLSIASLARACRMPSSTARSILQGGQSSASVENLTSLLLTFMSVDEVTQLLRKHSDERFWKGLLGKFKEPIGDKREVTGEVGRGFRWQHPDHLILAMACLSGGVDPSWLVRKFGEFSALPRIQALLDEGFIREINGRLKIQKDFLYFPDVEDSRQKAELHAQHWKAGEMESGGWLYHLTQSYTEDKHEKAKELTREYLDRLSELGKAGNGDKVLVFSIVASLLDGGMK